MIHQLLAVLAANIATTVISILGACVAGVTAIIYANHRKSKAANPEPELPTKLTSENITQRFTSAIPEITKELNLEVATAKQVETFNCSNTRSLLWGLISMGTNVAQISVPVTYRFHVRLRDPWTLETRQEAVVVHAPPLLAALPPAIHTEEMEKLAQRGWARGSPANQLIELERQITPTLIQFATDPRRLNLVRDIARKSVAEFVRLWLERECQWGHERFTQIQVRFADEPALPLAPTLKLLS